MHSLIEQGSLPRKCYPTIVFMDAPFLIISNDNIYLIANIYPFVRLLIENKLVAIATINGIPKEYLINEERLLGGVRCGGIRYLPFFWTVIL